MWLIPMHTFPASGNRELWSGSCLSQVMISDQYRFKILLFQINIPTFNIVTKVKVTKMCPKYLFDLSSDLNVSAPNTDK